MTIETQLTSLALCKRLKQLGATQSTVFYWVKRRGSDGQERWEIEQGQGSDSNVSAYTATELGTFLPNHVHNVKFEAGWYCEIAPSRHFEAESEADARAKLLIFLIEQGIVTP